jgi:hypothetical protein
MSYACYDITQLDGREANIFIVICFVGISLCWCSFMIHASVRPMLSLWSSDKCSSMYGAVISSFCSTLKCASLTELQSLSTKLFWPILSFSQSTLVWWYRQAYPFSIFYEIYATLDHFFCCVTFHNRTHWVSTIPHIGRQNCQVTLIQKHTM